MNAAAAPAIIQFPGSNPTALRLALFDNGWQPIPITAPDPADKDAGKKPVLANWRNITLTPTIIRSWGAGPRRKDTNTGLRTRGLVAVDIDVLDQSLSERLLALAVKMLGETPLIRVGKAPKMLACYKAALDVRKAMTPEFFFDDGSKAAVECLSDGQQFVAFGIHPGTGKPYHWLGLSPMDIPAADLPVADALHVQEFVREAEALLRQAGGKTAKDLRGIAERPERPRKATTPRPGDWPRPTRADVESALTAVPNTHDWHGWFKIGAAIFDALGNEGEEIFARWSAQSSKDVPADTIEKYRSFSRSAPTVTSASLFYEARNNGWLSERELDRVRAAPPHHTPEPPPMEKVPIEAYAETTKASSDDLITEDSIALAFAAAHKDHLRFDHSADKWFHWNGVTWRQEKTKLAFAWARDLARDLAAESDNFKAQLSAGKASFASGVERMARADRVFAITNDLWNTDPYLLGTPGGTVDLRTGELRPSRQSDHITKQTAVTPAETADCPAWLKFLKETTRNDEKLIGFLQRWFGYTLTGDTREHALLFAWGPGGNGKGVLMNTVSGILAEYATTAAMDTFVTSFGNKHTTDLAMLAGARMVMTTEVDEGQTWAEAKIKALTGGDPITARFMRQDNFTFVPTFKLTVSGNHKPNLNTVDDAIRRRLNLAPFLYKPETPDKTLPERLKREWPGILRWLIDGCLEWLQFGLNPPKAVLDATKDYFEAQDFYGRWLTECCKIHPSLEVKPGNLLRSFQAWCAENGETFTDNKKLRGMLERTPGVRYGATKGTQIVRGIGLNAAADPRQQPDD